MFGGQKIGSTTPPWGRHHSPPFKEASCSHTKEKSSRQAEESFRPRNKFWSKSENAVGKQKNPSIPEKNRKGIPQEICNSVIPFEEVEILSQIKKGGMSMVHKAMYLVI